ncbi:MAG TPA: hypothetical protein VFQ20_04860 [Burkholderiaceae bacterium]|nr:hypothetical protein [Burkholderiaceae bacterium]
MDALNRLRALSALVATATLAAACGGGSDAPPPPPPPPPPPASVNITGKAVDGALQGATACYDYNDNKVCDTGDPVSTAATSADGAFTIPVLATEAGKHRTIVNVPATAIDADTGAAVGFAFTLVVPPTGNAAAHSVFASPLSTLVQQQIDNAGQTQAEAVAYVQAQLGLAVSPLADFTAASNADNLKAANAARVTVSTLKQQTAALTTAAVTTAIGQTDVSGGTVTQAHVDALVVKAVAGALTVIGGSAADPSLAGKTGTALAAAVTALATKVVTQIGLTVPEAVTAIGIDKLPPEPPSTATPSEGASLAALRYTSATDWYMRRFQSTAADNTPDANGLTRSYDVRSRTDAYNYAAGSPVVISWVLNNDSNRAGDRYWNGSTWRTCDLGTRTTGTPRDANGRNSYNYCDGFEKGTTVRSALDISGQTLASVLTTKIRTLAGGSSGVNYADWGPADLTLLGNAVFPTGSRLHYQTGTPLEAAIAYDPRDLNVVTVFSQAVADGGDARSGSPACAVAGITALAATSLEEMAARSPGKPCVFNAATNADGTSLNPNESWGPTTVSAANINNYYATLPAGTGNYYTPLGRMRISFTGTGNGVVYHECLDRRTPTSTRNCTEIGRGSYTIATLGDARVMTFSNQPAAFARANFERVFVERGGKVYFGYRNPVGVSTPQVRLNLPAANAMLKQLGLPQMQAADAPKPLTGAKAAAAALLKGAWSLVEADGAAILRVAADGQYMLAQAAAPQGAGRSGVEWGWMDLDTATGRYGVLVEIDSNGDFGLSHPNAASTETTTVTDTTLTFGADAVPRLTDDPNGLVGLWAFGSATDLKTTHFAFFANGKVLSIHPAETEGACLTARQGPPGIEWSDYTFNATTGALRIFNKIYDTSGCTGVFDSADPVPNTEINLVLTMATDKKTFTAPVDGGATIATFYRIAPR